MTEDRPVYAWWSHKHFIQFLEEEASPEHDLRLDIWVGPGGPVTTTAVTFSDTDDSYQEVYDDAVCLGKVTIAAGSWKIPNYLYQKIISAVDGSTTYPIMIEYTDAGSEKMKHPDLSPKHVVQPYWKEMESWFTSAIDSPSVSEISKETGNKHATYQNIGTRNPISKEDLRELDIFLRSKNGPGYNPLG